MTKDKFRVLVVDDEQGYCDVMKMILTGQGYQVETCNNGRQALKMLENKIFDLVVSDIQMPELDGFGLLKEIKRRDYDMLPL